MKNFKSMLPLACGIMLILSACEKPEMDEQINGNIRSKEKAAVYSASKWMQLLNDNTSLAKISIPGSHDAAARVEPVAGTAKCQNLTLTDQYNTGVRFVDIRCRHIDNAFAIHHGSIYQNLNFDDVLNATIGFLNSNPSECIIMCVKEEYNPSNTTRSFEATFDAYVAKNPGKWHLGTGIPTLGQVRGKIVLLRRFGATNKGIPATNWADNTTFTIDNGNSKLRVQDYYNVSGTDAKWNSVSAMLNEAYSSNYETLYLNFTSGYKSIIFGIPSITTVSNAINPKVYNFFGSNVSGRYGIIIMDFTDAGRCTRIINTNFPIAAGTYAIKSKQSGLVLDDPGFSTAEGTNIIVYPDNATNNQRWTFTPCGGGYYTIVNVTSGLAIDGGPNVQTTLLWQWGLNYTPAQLWLLRPTQNGYSIISQQTGLAIDGAANAPDVKIQLWEANQTDNQVWYFN